MSSPEQPDQLQLTGVHSPEVHGPQTPLIVIDEPAERRSSATSADTERNSPPVLNPEYMRPETEDR